MTNNLEDKSKTVQKAVTSIFNALWEMAQKTTHPIQMHSFFNKLTDIVENVEKDAYKQGFEEGKKRWHENIPTN